MIYYLVQAYMKEVDEEYKRHIYPNYLTAYSLKVGGSGFGLQSGFVDAIKFTSKDQIKSFMERAVEIFGNKYEFEVVEFNAKVFGRVTPRFIFEPESSEA